ncbi:MAG: hypothetical protein Q4D26_11770 [Clostridia bacterium]|nr:hypothetical protein [Clostridia bacterium]
MSVYNSIEDLVQNLKDAGCNNDIITIFMDLYSNGKSKEELSLLNKHRKLLLSKLHEIQNNISNLDYLIYQLNKEAQ